MKNLVKISAAAIFAASLALSTSAAVKIGGNNSQTTNIQGAVANTAVGGSKVTQNISSNHGKVTIGGNNVQTTNIQGAVANTAVGGSTSVQNLSSNSSE